MEVNVQILAGAAITVFLALLFFGVVVLWDVALALRSVGDKIDKLEDNVDDDLMEIAHVMDRRSPGQSGGGTQLHLNGGTISSGPGSAESQQPPRATPEGDRRQYGPHREQQPPGPEAGPQPRQRPPEPERQAHAPTADEPAERTATGGAEPDEEGSPADDAEPDPSDSATEAEPDADDGAAARDESDGESGRDESDDAADDPHPRADASRGRFVTSPDRTAWYATPLDRTAIAEARSPIAGELTDGSERGVDEADVIAAGPAPTGGSPVGGGTESATGPRGVLRAGSVDERETAPDDASQPADGRDSGASEDADESTAAADSSAELAFEGESASTSGGAAPGGGDGADAEAAVGPSTEPTASEAPRDGTPTPDHEEPAADPAAPPAEDPLEFDVGDEGDDVTLEEAVEAMNEDAPVPELSSHRFDVAAEMDGDRAVLEFSFDPEAVEISGSTKRLLQYQLRSFADRESTPDGEVTIDRHRIVVELGDDGDDGNAVTNWGEAVVTIVDRTLFLSDNSN